MEAARFRSMLMHIAKIAKKKLRVQGLWQGMYHSAHECYHVKHLLSKFAYLYIEEQESGCSEEDFPHEDEANARPGRSRRVGPGGSTTILRLWDFDYNFEFWDLQIWYVAADASLNVLHRSSVREPGVKHSLPGIAMQMLVGYLIIIYSPKFKQ